jgi:hypothetical protein
VGGVRGPGDLAIAREFKRKGEIDFAMGDYRHFARYFYPCSGIAIILFVARGQEAAAFDHPGASVYGLDPVLAGEVGAGIPAVLV